MSETSEHEPAMVRQGHLISEISNLLPTEVEGAWERLVYTPRMVSMYSEENLVVHRGDGVVDGALSPDDVVELLEELREVMYRPGAGTWLSAEWVISDDGGNWTTEVTFNYDDEPAWYDPIDPGLYGLDLEKFPRRDGSVPAWMGAKLDEARARAE